MKPQSSLALKSLWSWAWLALAASWLAAHSIPNLHAQSVPAAINYQGRLTDAAGQPIAAGVYTIEFRIWDKPVSGANERPIWGREYDVTVIGGGVFNVVLGAPGGTGLLAAQTSDLTAAFTGGDRYLGITITKAAGQVLGAAREMLPRQQILSAPYALRAEQAASASSLTPKLYSALCPTGTVIAWMGVNNTPPEGWEFCWGQEVERADPKYQDLFRVIGISNGVGKTEATFRLPDLRGMFLRGVNGERNDPYADPDATSRTNSVTGGNTGNRVGSVQMDEIRSHTHAVAYGGARRFFVNYGGGGEVWDQPQTTSATGGQESRPKNVYVQYLIKL